MELFISPAEPANVKAALERAGFELASHGLCERYGVDFLWREQGSWWGVQRKTVPDFVASLHDGRLQREAAQMVSRVSLPTIFLEGRAQFTATSGADGVHQTLTGVHHEVTLQQWRSMMWSLAAAGITVTSTSGVPDTALTLKQMVKWTSKAKHTALTQRPKTVDSKWGTPTSRDFGVHILQGFDGVGPELAGAIFDHFGRVPLTWVADGVELEDVPGIGPTRAKKLRKALA